MGDGEGGETITGKTILCDIHREAVEKFQRAEVKRKEEKVKKKKSAASVIFLHFTLYIFSSLICFSHPRLLSFRLIFLTWIKRFFFRVCCWLLVGAMEEHTTLTYTHPAYPSHLACG